MGWLKGYGGEEGAYGDYGEAVEPDEQRAGSTWIGDVEGAGEGEEDVGDEWDDEERRRGEEEPVGEGCSEATSRVSHGGDEDLLATRIY